MTEEETQKLAAWQAVELVNMLRRAGWVFAAVVCWTRKSGPEPGIAGASFFDIHRDESRYLPTLADAVRNVATEMDKAHRASGAREFCGDGYLHTLGGTGVRNAAVLAAVREASESDLRAHCCKELDGTWTHAVARAELKFRGLL